MFENRDSPRFRDIISAVAREFPRFTFVGTVNGVSGMSTPQMQRKQIENDILSLARAVDIGNVRWAQSEAFSKFIDAWQNLARYYQNSRDTLLDAHVLKIYMRFAVMLRSMGEDGGLAPRRRRDAKEALKALNEKMDEVFRQIERNGGVRTAV
jgi:hypothetical protein